MFYFQLPRSGEEKVVTCKASAGLCAWLRRVETKPGLGWEANTRREAGWQGLTGLFPRALPIFQ